MDLSNNCLLPEVFDRKAVKRDINRLEKALIELDSVIDRCIDEAIANKATPSERESYKDEHAEELNVLKAKLREKSEHPLRNRIAVLTKLDEILEQNQK